MHTLDLDFGNAARGNRAALILSGWVDWADGSTFLAAAQAHRDLTFPYLQVKDAAGNWRTVVEDMGIPAGKPKTIAVDLSGKFLSSSREVRIVTNLCLYWDEIFLIGNSAPPEAKDFVPVEAEIGRNLSHREQRPARSAAHRGGYDRRGPALPRFLQSGHSSRTQAARGVRLRAGERHVDSEPRPRQLDALRGGGAVARRARRPHGDHGFRRRSATALPRRRIAATAGGMEARLPAEIGRA